MKKLFDVPGSYKEHITKFDIMDGFLVFSVGYNSNIFCGYGDFRYNCTICFSIANHYYWWRNKCVFCGFGSFMS